MNSRPVRSPGRVAHLLRPDSLGRDEGCRPDGALSVPAPDGVHGPLDVAPPPRGRSGVPGEADAGLCGRPRSGGPSDQLGGPEQAQLAAGGGALRLERRDAHPDEAHAGGDVDALEEGRGDGGDLARALERPAERVRPGDGTEVAEANLQVDGPTDDPGRTKARADRVGEPDDLDVEPVVVVQVAGEGLLVADGLHLAVSLDGP